MIVHTNNWRRTSSFDALELIKKHHLRFGLTRIANITNLDCIGIPIHIGLRARGKTLCVSAGKGLSHIDSIVSAGMESIEIDVAEKGTNCDYFNSCYNDLPGDQLISFESIPSYIYSCFTRQSLVTWMQPVGIHSGRKFCYPASLVSLDKSFILEPLNTFPWSSNGLASGLTHDDAILSGLYEVIERDAWSCWEYIHRTRSVPFSSIITETIHFASTNELIRKIKDASFDIIINPLMTDLGLPVYRCLLLNSSDQAGAISLGFGCHHSSEVALNRAITEAAQARAVYISGARDDIVLNSILKSDNFCIDDFKKLFIPSVFEDSECSMPTNQSPIGDILERVSQLGMHEPLVYTFKNSEPFSVVRILSPSMAPSGGRKGLSLSKHPRITTFKPNLKGLSALFGDRA